MMVKSAQSFTLSTITSKAVVYAPAERADSLPLFLLYPCMDSVVGSSKFQLKGDGGFVEPKIYQPNVRGTESTVSPNPLSHIP
jgi:hypothetical protein